MRTRAQSAEGSAESPSSMHPDRDVDAPRSRLPTTFLALLAIAGAILLFMSLVYQRPAGTGMNHPGIGGNLPNVTLQPLLNADETLALDDLRGKVTLID